MRLRKDQVAIAEASSDTQAIEADTAITDASATGGDGKVVEAAVVEEDKKEGEGEKTVEAPVVEGGDEKEPGAA